MSLRVSTVLAFSEGARDQRLDCRRRDASNPPTAIQPPANPAVPRPTPVNGRPWLPPVALPVALETADVAFSVVPPVVTALGIVVVDVVLVGFGVVVVVAAFRTVVVVVARGADVVDVVGPGYAPLPVGDVVAYASQALSTSAAATASAARNARVVLWMRAYTLPTLLERVLRGGRPARPLAN